MLESNEINGNLGTKQVKGSFGFEGTKTVTPDWIMKPHLNTFSYNSELKLTLWLKINKLSTILKTSLIQKIY